MRPLSGQTFRCECGAETPASRARCRSCGRTRAASAAPLDAVGATLAQQRERVARLIGQARGAAAVAAAQLHDRQAAHAGEAARAEARERAAIAADASFRRQRAQAELDALLAPLADSPALTAWRSPAWRTPPAPGRPPQLLRLGAIPQQPGGAAQPAVMTPGIGSGHLVVRAAAARRDEALGAVSAVLLRALASLPPGHVRFRLHDPLGLGSSLDGFAAFPAYVARGRATTSSAQLRAVVEELVEHANGISADYLRGRHATLLDFLDEAGHGEVPLQLLVLLDHPQAVDPDTTAQLTRLAGSAASRGIMLVVHDTGDSPLTLPGATVVHADASGRWHSSLLPSTRFALDAPPPPELVAAVAARRLPRAAPLLFEELNAGEPRASRSSAGGLAAAVGRGGVDQVEAVLDDDVPHGLVAGDPGSGKSNLLRTFVYGLARRYGPDQLQLYLLDFKEGIEFREFAPADGDPTFLPHARVVSTNSSRAFGVEVLEHVSRLVRDRYALLPDNAKKLSTLREREPARELPRILLVADEFHVLFERGDQLAERAVVALTQIAKQGRAAGVHFLLATQAIGDVGSGNPNAARLDGVVNAARLRIGLRLDERESQALLRLGNRAAAELHEPGVAIVNALQGDESGNRRTKVALLSDAVALRERRESLSAVVGARRPPRVFDGAEGADPARNDELRRALRGRAPAPHRTWVGADLALDGEDPRSHPPIAIDFVPDAHRHLAVVGAGARGAVSALQWAAVGLGASSPETAFTLVDLLRDGDDVPAGAVAACAAALGRLGCAVEVVRERDAAPLARRLQALVGAAAGRHAVVVFGADRLARAAEPLDPDDGGYAPATPQSVMRELLPAAGSAGIHLLGWWSTWDAFDEQLGMQLHQVGIRLFLELSDQRVSAATGGQISAAEQWPLALLHDVATGGSVRTAHLFDPFGSDAAPAFLEGAR